MPTNTSQRLNRQFAWRIARLWMVVFALGLALVAIVLQYQQSGQYTEYLVKQTHNNAIGVRDDARKAFDSQLANALRETAEFRRTPYPDEFVLSEPWPVWLDWVFEWDGANWTEVQPPAVPDQERAEVILTRANEWVLSPTGRPVSNPGLEYVDYQGKPLVLAYFRSGTQGHDFLVHVGRINTELLKKRLIEPMIAPAMGLRLIDTPPQLSDVVRLFGPAKYWSLDPNPFLTNKRSAAILLLIANAVLTIIALGTLLGGLWYVLRLTRDEVALAELKSDFAANVSHELKTPLAVIRMYSETLYDGRVPSEEKKQQYYSIIGRESTRLTKMINNILDFARIESGKTEYKLEPTDVAEVVRDTYNDYREHLDYSGFEHVLKIGDDLPRINADRDAIAQVLVNLIGNAIKYSADDRYLEIETVEDTRRNRRGVLLSIHDRGIGIKPADQPHLFDGFFRAQDGLVRKVSGTGLGLALVKHIVDAHHGSVSVESRLVKGTTFRVFLPASEKETTSDDESEVAASTRSGLSDEHEGGDGDRSSLRGAAPAEM